MAADQPSTHLERRLTLETCRECASDRGDWHDSACSVGRRGPGRVRDVDVERTVYLSAEDVLAALETYFHPQNPHDMHPADFLTKRFELPGHEGLEYV